MARGAAADAAPASGARPYTLSQYLLDDFGIEQVEAALLALSSDEQARLPGTARAYFHLVLKGRAALKLSGVDGICELAPGDFALLLYGSAHTLGAVGGRRLRKPVPITRFDSGDELAELPRAQPDAPLRLLCGTLWLGWSPRKAPVNRALPLLLTQRFGETGSLAAEPAAIERACRGAGGAAFVHALVQLQLMQLLRQVHDELRALIELRIGAPELGRIAAIVRKVNAHPERPWTVASLAHEVGYSRSAFAEKFKAQTGLGPIAYVTRARLKRALALLDSQRELPLWEIALRVGYESQGTFTRVFKAQYGLSPRAYLQKSPAIPAAPSKRRKPAKK